MGVLAWVAALAAVTAVGGCYAPSLRDCTVSCAAASDCASGQVCGDDGLCAAPDVAGRCLAMADAGPGNDAPHDAAPRDAAASPDGPLVVKLQVQVDGKGAIEVEGVGTCSSLEPQRGKCAYDIALGVAQRLQAVPIDNDVFEAWRSPACAGQGPVCTFVPLISTMVTAKFGRERGD